MAVEYRPIQPGDYIEVRSFLSELGWAQRVDDPERFRAMVENVSRTMVAIDAGRVVGFARALCDEVSNGYISLVGVAADRRREGIGRRLVERLTADDPQDRITWVLRAGRDSKAFWERIGFKPSQIAMERVRGQNRRLPVQTPLPR